MRRIAGPAIRKEAGRGGPGGRGSLGSNRRSGSLGSNYSRLARLSRSRIAFRAQCFLIAPMLRSSNEVGHTYETGLQTA
jgi:hypothetical protein